IGSKGSGAAVRPAPKARKPARHRASAPAQSVWERLGERISPADYIPVLRSDLTWVREKPRHGDPYVMLADRGNAYFSLSEENDFIATRMDGTRRISDLVVEYFHQFGS